MSEATPTWPPTFEWHDNNRHAKLNDGKTLLSQPYTKNNKRLQNTESETNSLPQEKAKQLAIKYPVWKHTNKYITQTEQVIFRNKHVHI